MVSQRFYCLASDKQLWKAAYYASFGQHMEKHIRPSFSNQSFEPNACNLFYKYQTVTSWQKLYKIKHNWSRGECRACTVLIAEKQPRPQSLAQVCGELIVTADQGHGLRIWRVNDGAVSLDASGKLLPECSSVKQPSAVALSRLEVLPWMLWIVLGFSDGMICVQTYDTRTRHIQIHENNSGLTSHAIVSLDFKYPYVVLLTFDQTFTLVQIDAEDIYSTGKAGNKIRILNSLKANSVWCPLNISMRAQRNFITVSVAYSMPCYLVGWSVGLQEMLLDINGVLLRTRTAKMTDQAEICQPTIGRKDLNAACSPSRTQPNTLSYAYPFLITAQPDNTLILYKITSTKRSFFVEATACLSGHTSSITGVFVSNGGRAVSVGARGSDVRIWDLEACIAGNKPGGYGALGISLQPSPLKSEKRCKIKDYMTVQDDITAEWAAVSNWIGAQDEKLLVLQETEQGSEILKIYDFS